MQRKYSTLNYLRDSIHYLDILIAFFEKRKIKFRKFFSSIYNFDYYYHLVRIIGNLPYALIIIYLGLLAVFTLLKYSQGTFGLRISSIYTNSMYPTVRPGSEVVSTQQQEFKLGDIISYKEVNYLTHIETGRIITHRIIAAGNGGFITQGDSNSHPDPVVVGNEYILGRVRSVIPYLGYLYLILKTPPGFVFFIVIPTLLLIKNEVNYLRSLKKLHFLRD